MIQQVASTLAFVVTITIAWHEGWPVSCQHDRALVLPYSCIQHVDKAAAVHLATNGITFIMSSDFPTSRLTGEQQ